MKTGNDSHTPTTGKGPFTDKFDDYVVAGESISIELCGTTYTATIEFDADASLDDCDNWNVDQTVTGCDSQQQEKLLSDREAWHNNEWWFGCIVLSAETADGWNKDHLGSLSGIEVNYPEGDNNYLTEVATELLHEYFVECATEQRQHLVNHCTDSMMNEALLGAVIPSAEVKDVAAMFPSGT